MPRLSEATTFSLMERSCKTGTIGTIGTTSFFPSKNLGLMEMAAQYLQMTASLAELLK